MYVIYFIIAVLSTTLGSLVGLGGGVIIKPVLDALKDYNLFTVSILSSTTVFAMAVVSVLKKMQSGVKFNLNMIKLVFGAVLGGILGKLLFDKFLIMFKNENTPRAIQATILIGLLLLVLFKKYLPKYRIKNSILVFIMGLILGTLASFLGVGGGPINVAILTIFFSYDIKEASINSIFIILLSQFSKLILIVFQTDIFNYDLQMLPLMVIGGILGGLIGSKLNQQLSNLFLEKLFNIAVMCIITINIYNLYISTHI